MKPKPWKTLSSRPVYENRWMQLREDVAEMPNGRTTIYGVVTFGDCVGVVPFVDADAGPPGPPVPLRAGARTIAGRSPPAGSRQGETLEEAAQRELAEEAGYRAGRLTHVSSYYTSKCICDETAHLYVGEDLDPSRGRSRRHRIPGATAVSLRRGAAHGAGG